MYEFGDFKWSIIIYSVQTDRPNLIYFLKSLFYSITRKAGNIKMPNGFFDKTNKKRSKTEKVKITIELYILKIV